MDFAKYIFAIVGSITLFGLIGGLEPNITLVEMILKAVFVGLIFATGLVVKEVIHSYFSKIN